MPRRPHAPYELVVPILLAHVASITASATVVATAEPATAFQAPDGRRWVVVDPPACAARALREASWCHALEPAWAVAVLLDAPDLALPLTVLRRSARDTVSVSDPDFGRVAYALFDSPALALAALDATGRPSPGAPDW